MICVKARPGIPNPIRDMNSNQLHEQAKLAHESLTDEGQYEIKLVNGEFMRVYDKENTMQSLDPTGEG